MSTAPANDPVVIGTYGFNVPCRRFLVTANVTRDRRIPIVDEFLLRTLKICERLPIRRVGAFFGFSSAETETVMADLIGRGLVVAEGDFVTLHPSSHEMFRGADGLPRMIEINAWVDRIWFDLVSRNMMTPERQRPLRNLIDLRADNSGRDVPTTFVRKAFENNFAEYLKKVRRINNPERFGLYSISDVQPDRFGSVIIKGTEEIVFDPQPRIRPKLLEVEIENLARYRPLTDAMSDAYRRLWWPAPSASALDEFQRLIGDTSVEQAHHNQAFDLQDWLARNEAIGAHWQPLVGASYLKRNIDFLTRLIGQRLKSGSVAGVGSEASLVWFRPGGSAWGTSPDLQEALVAIRASLRTKFPKVSVRTTLAVPSITGREPARRFDRIFDEGYLAPAGYISPTLEVALLAGIAALVLVRVAFSANVSTFVGYATVDPPSVKRVSDGLQWLTTRDRADELWNRARQRAEEEDDSWTEGDLSV